MPARPVWEGHLRLSLVTCPIALHKAVGEGDDIHFHMLHPTTHNRVKQVWRDAGTGEEVSRRDLVRGFEVAKDEYCLVTDDDLKSLRIESTKVIDIERFVDCSEIDRLYWDEPYYMVPTGKTGFEPFAVIREAMRGEKRVAIGRVVMASREHVVAIEARKDGMLLSRLRAHDEVRADAEVFDAIPEVRISPQMVELAKTIIAQQVGPFDPDEFHDRYQEALGQLVERKAHGAKPRAAREQPAESNVIDLMEALKRSLKGEPPKAAPAAKSGVKAAPKAKSAKPPARKRA